MSTTATKYHIPGEPLISAPSDDTAQSYRSFSKESLTAAAVVTAYESPFGLLLANQYMHNSSVSEKIAAGAVGSGLFALGITAVCVALVEE